MWYYIPDYINWLLGYGQNEKVETVQETKEIIQLKTVETQIEPEPEPEQEPVEISQKRKNKYRGNYY